MSGYRIMLLDGVAGLVKRHFGAISEHVIYEGAVLTPCRLPWDCAELAKAILTKEPRFADAFSVEDVSRRIESTVITIVREGTSRMPELIDRLCARFERQDESKLVLIPLQGITPTEAVTHLGPFRLRVMDDEAISEVVALWDATIHGTTNTPDEKAAAKKCFLDDLEETALRGSICLEVRICADAMRAEALAIQQAAAVIDLLRYGSSGLHHKSMNLAIGFKGDAVSGSYRRYILPLGESEASTSSFRTGPFGTLVLDEESLRIMSDLGVQRLAGVLQRPMSQFEVAVVRAIHWFGEARMQTKPEYEVVTLAIAIEAALAIPGQQNHGRNTLSEAVAVLLSDDATERAQVFDLTRSALSSRGDVVHQGLANLEWDGLERFRNVVRDFMAAAIRSIDRFQTTADFLLWVTSKNSGLVKPRTHGKRNN